MIAVAGYRVSPFLREDAGTMRVEYECAGGQADLHLTCRADTDTLPPERGAELRRLVEASGVLGMHSGDLGPAGGGPPEGLVYRLAVHGDGGQVVLSFNDVTAPPGLRPLLTFLQELAAARARGPYRR